MSNGLIVANHLTDEGGCDGAIAPTLIGQTGHIDSIVADNMFYRYTTLLGDQLRARGENPRQVESILACNILNQLR